MSAKFSVRFGVFVALGFHFSKLLVNRFTVILFSLLFTRPNFPVSCREPTMPHRELEILTCCRCRVVCAVSFLSPHFCASFSLLLFLLSYSLVCASHLTYLKTPSTIANALECPLFASSGYSQVLPPSQDSVPPLSSLSHGSAQASSYRRDARSG